MTPEHWKTKHPAHPWLAADDCDGVQALLAHMQALRDGERVASCSKAGEGNMNLTLRVLLASPAGQRTLIVKQSRPWVEKYDFIAAPWDRANVEAAFLQKVATVPVLAARMPAVIAADADARVLVMHDLGAGSDFFSLYQDATIAPETLAALARWLGTLHMTFRGAQDAALVNREMRRLNHAHMFVIPLTDPTTMNLAQFDSDLPEAAAELRGDANYRQIVAGAGERYLHDGACLLHGDFFPGSWLQTGNGGATSDVFVIDPEFCFFGEAEFDLGVAVAHFALAQTPRATAETFLKSYGEPFDRARLGINAGIEVMRRLIGVAQLPLGQSLDRVALLRRSHRAVLERKWEWLWQS